MFDRARFRFTYALVATILTRPSLGVAALYWSLTGRRQRARNRLRVGIEQGPHAYRLWIDALERQADVMAQAPAAIARWSHRPRFSVLLHVTPALTAPLAKRLRAALSAQVYPDWELVLVDDGHADAPIGFEAPAVIHAPGTTSNTASALERGIAAATGDYLLVLPADGLLPPTALFRYAEALQSHPHADILFGDHDRIDLKGHRSDPWFKPCWDAEQCLAQDYVSPACVLRSDAARACLPLAPECAGVAAYALVLAMTARADTQVVRVPHVVAHLPAPAPDNTADQSARQIAVAHHLRGTGADVTAGPFGTLRVLWPLPAPEALPLVGIVIPIRDRIALLETSLGGVLANTSYPNIEIIIVDNGSVEPATHAYLSRVSEDPRVRVLRDDGPFNFSRLNNRAAAIAHGSYLCLLNNDVEIIDAEWLTALMRHAIRADVGAVGALLLYGDGAIQHAGVVVGMGNAAGHAHRFQKRTALGYFAQAHVARTVGAVTAACLLIEKRKYDEVGGLDETAFAVAFNDVDFCMKLTRAGWRNVYAPDAVLIHHESKSRRRDTAPDQHARYLAERDTLVARWHTDSCEDPAHHPALDRESETYIVRV